MASIGGFLSGGLNLLDLPGSMARDLLAGENPLDQLRDPFGETGRQMRSGRDLARRWGWAGPQNTWGNLLGGMALEVATDPITWASGGLLGAAKLLGPASKAGRAAMIASKAVDPLGTAVGAGVGHIAKGLARYPTLQAMASADLPPIELGKPWLRKEILAKSAKESAPRIGYTPGAVAAASQETVPRIGHTPYAPPFYSRLERAVEKLSDKPIKANPQRVLKSLKAAAGREGFAEKEVNYRRLMDALEGKQTVTKADLMKQLNSKPLSLELVRYAENLPSYEVRADKWPVYDKLMGRFPTEEAADRFVRERMKESPDTLFRTRAMRPNYPEFTMPGGRNLTEDLLVHPPEQAGYTYRSGHYEDVPNWVTEVVSKDYDLPGGGVGKVAQEIQSDQMQTLSQKADLRASYATMVDQETEVLNSLFAKRDDLKRQLRSLEPGISENSLSIRHRLHRLNADIETAQGNVRSLQNMVQDLTVPGSPFESEWENLGIKDLIRQTAESPTATQFGWLTGEDMARWAANAGNDPSERVLKGLQQHADVVLPQKAQRITGLPMERAQEALGATANPIDELASFEDIANTLGTPDEDWLVERVAREFGISENDARAIGQAYGEWMPAGTDASWAELERIGAMLQTAMRQPKRPAWLRQMSPELRHRALYEGFPYMALAGAAPLGAAAMYAALEGRGQPRYQESF